MKKILLFFVLIFSFSVQARLYEVQTISDLGCASVGDIVDPVPLANCHIGKEFSCGWTTCKITSVRSIDERYIWMNFINHKGRPDSDWFVIFKPGAATCDLPNQINENGVCEKPPEPSYCESDKAQNTINEASSHCSSINGHFSYRCSDETESVETSCNSDPLECTPQDAKWPDCVKPPEPPPEECKEGSSTWPMCADVPKCTSTNPKWPFCLFPPETGTPDNPDLPSPDKPDVNDPTAPLPTVPDSSGDVDVLPESEGNGNILIAIADLNKDNNKLITSLHNDLNKGLNINADGLEAINKNTIGFWQDSINGFNNINQSINNQNDVIRETGDMTNNFLGTLTRVTDDGFDKVVNALDDLNADKRITIDEYKAEGLYTSQQLSHLNIEVENLKGQYAAELNKFKAYFNFKTDVESGEYNSHTLKQNWGGKELSFENFALTVFVDNADIIGLIIIFGFGIAGIRIILESI